MRIWVSSVAGRRLLNRQSQPLSGFSEIPNSKRFMLRSQIKTDPHVVWLRSRVCGFLARRNNLETSNLKWGSDMSFGTKSGGDAAEAIQQANALAIKELRRQFDKSEKNIQPFIDAGSGALGDVISGSTLEGFGDTLRRIFSGGDLDPLVDERTEAARAGQAAVGLSRSGPALEEIAAIPQDLALALEDTLFGRQAGLTNTGLSGANSLGQFGANASQGVANLFSQTGRAQASGINQDAQTRSGNIGQISKIGGSILGSKGFASAFPKIASFFSDPNLKENVEEIGEICLLSGSLKLYQWDWKPECKGTIVECYPQVGMMADEVKELYPEFVIPYGGYDTVAYQPLLTHLEKQGAIDVHKIKESEMIEV